jgi:hypothetical protein
MNPTESRVDHLVYATPDLDRGIAEIEQLLGVRASAGGQHPGRGTRNALLALGPASYLEIIAPDPEQPPPAPGRAFHVDDLRQSRLVTWAAKGQHLEELRKEAVVHGISLGELLPGSRRRLDGVTLSWQFTSPDAWLADGIIPFFIDWGDSPHPASNATPGLTLRDLSAEHPDAEGVSVTLRRLGLEMPVRSAPAPALITVIQGPLGRVELR